MSTFNPKEAFRQAREDEKAGKKKAASAGYSSLAVYLRRRGRPKDAKSMAERAIVLSPESPRLYIQLALCEAALGDETAARRATAHFTKHTIQKGKVEEYQPYLETQLRSHASLRQIFYEALLDLDRTTAGPFLKLAQSFIEQNKWKEARRSLLDGFRTRTEDAVVLGKLKELLLRQQDNESAGYIDLFETGKIARNDLIELLSGSKPKLLLEKRREPREEEKNLQTLIEELEAEMGIDLRDSHDGVEPLVREFRRKSSEILEGDSKARIDMALAFFEMGLSRDARDELSHIRSTDPHYLESQMLLGEILYGERSDLGALEVFQNVLRDERASPEVALEAKFKLLLIYHRLGDLRQALTIAKELEKKSPGYRDTQRLLVQIQEVIGNAEESEVRPARRASGRRKG